MISTDTTSGWALRTLSSTVATIAGLTPEQREDAIEQAAAAAGGVNDPAVRRALESLRDSDNSPKVREAARRALAPQP